MVLFGANRAAKTAADERLAGAQALWHEARVSVAAEVAQQTSSIRTCLAQQQVAERDAQSRGETSRLSQLVSARASPRPPRPHWPAPAPPEPRPVPRSSACNAMWKSRPWWRSPAGKNPTLRARLAQPVAAAPDALFTVDALPAQVLAQRPDVYNAIEREVAAASADVASAQAQRYPRLTLSGSVGAAQVRTGGVTTDLNT